MRNLSNNFLVKTWLLFALVIFINGFFNAKFQLHYDEAYYWVWGKNFSLSYFDHPPLIGYLIALASIFGHNEFVVRLPALISASLTVYIIYKLALDMFEEKVANISLLLALSLPGLQGGFFLSTPDAPLCMFWILTIYYFYQGLNKNIKYLYLSGVASGFALLCKYTAFLLFPILFVCAISNKEYRRAFLTKELYLSFCLAILIFTPVIIWNYQHDFASFKFQFNHGVGSNGFNFDLGMLFDFLGGQALIANPIIFIALIFYLVKNKQVTFKEPKLLFLTVPFIFGMLLFGALSIHKHMEANWPMPIYLTSVITLAYYLAKVNNKWVLRVSLAFIFILLTIIKMPGIFIPSSLKYKIPAINIFYGHKELLESRVKPYLKPDTKLVGCDYGIASHAWFYLNLPQVYVLSTLPFANGYKYWDYNKLNLLQTKRVIYICSFKDKKALQTLKDNFNEVKLLGIGNFKNDFVTNKIYIYSANN